MIGYRVTHGIDLEQAALYAFTMELLIAVLTSALTALLTVHYTDKTKERRRSEARLETAAQHVLAQLQMLDSQAQYLDGSSTFATQRYDQLRGQLHDLLSELVHAAVGAGRARWAMDYAHYVSPLMVEQIVPHAGERWFQPAIDRIVEAFPKLRPLTEVGETGNVWKEIEAAQGHPPVHFVEGLTIRAHALHAARNAAEQAANTGEVASATASTNDG